MSIKLISGRLTPPPTTQPYMLGGAMEGAATYDRETASWQPAVRSPDSIINPGKDLTDSRSRDIVINNGYAYGAVALQKDNIVGSNFKLNAMPDVDVLGVSEEWAESFQKQVEGLFTIFADSLDNHFDAAGKLDFTGLVRLAVGSYSITGEVLASVEWLNKDKTRPFNTAIQLINSDRLTNPNLWYDTNKIRKGIERDYYGRPVAYYIKSNTLDMFTYNTTITWKRVLAKKPWGRKQIIHIIEPLLPDQSRGFSDMTPVLKQMRMVKKFQDIMLQNAVVNASYAAAIESDVSPAMLYENMGGGEMSPMSGIAAFMNAMNNYYSGSKNIHIDGVKIPCLFPGTKLVTRNMGSPGGVGTDFEMSLLRLIGASTGLSYEQYSRDYTRTNYSSARASAVETWKGMQAKKTSIADRFATEVYILWFEEMWNAGKIKLPPGKQLSWFYEPGVKDALCKCSWIGASRGQIDELKETQAAVMRIASGFSTLEEECAKLGKDYRQVLRQRCRELKLTKEYGLDIATDTSKPKAEHFINNKDEPDETE